MDLVLLIYKGKQMKDGTKDFIANTIGFILVFPIFVFICCCFVPNTPNPFDVFGIIINWFK